MITFLFGAGASAGAGSILPERPPLGVELARELRRLCPGTWGSLPGDLARKLEEDFEVGMAAVTNAMSLAVPALMRDMAVYFVQFRSVGKTSLYDRLIRDLSERSLMGNVAFSTLNYECVLEYALLNAGHQIDYFGSGSGVPVLKLHGSCNMFSSGIQATPGIAYSQGVVFEGGIQAWLDSNRVIEHCLTQTALAPVMCQYMEGKPTSVSPSSLKEVQARWGEILGTSAAVVCIGIRPHPPDSHIWGPIAHAPGQLLFVGDQAAFDAWAAANRSASSKWLAPRFASGYEHLLNELEAL